MSETPFTTHGNEPIEARIVSWVLGEASAFEAAELQRLCDQQPELRIFKRRMEVLHGLLKEADQVAHDKRWKLPMAKRKAIEDVIGKELERDRDRRVRKSGQRAIWALAACLVLTLLVAGLMVIPSRSWKGGAPMAKESPVVVMYSADTHSDSYRESNSMVPFSGVATPLPQELIEGTPKPINVPGLVNPAESPAMQQLEGRLHAGVAEPPSAPRARQEEVKKELALDSLSSRRSLDRKGKEANKPATPAASSMAKVIASSAPNAANIPVPDVAVEEPMLESDNGIGFSQSWGGNAIAGGVYAGKAAASENPVEELRYANPSVVPTEGGQRLESKAKGLASGQGGEKFKANEALGHPRRKNLEGALKKDMDSDDKSVDLAAVDAFAPNAPAEHGGFKYSHGEKRRETESLTDAKEEAKSVDVTTKFVEVDPKAIFSTGEGAEFDGFMNYGSPIQGQTTTSGVQGQREFGDVSNFFSSQPAQDDVQKGIEQLRKDQLVEASEIEVSPKVEDQKPADVEKKRPVASQDETVAADEPYSTFSLNISDASFRVAQAALARGEQPDPNAIQVEQFYNAVDYGDPAPAAGQPVAGVIEQSAHPVIPGRNLLRMSVKTAAAGRSPSQALHLTLLVDLSGSMGREDRREAMNQALKGLSQLLTGNDRVSVVGFSRTPNLLADGLKGDQLKLDSMINMDANEGGTNLEEAIKLGEQLAKRHQQQGAQNRMVLFTDGAANLGDADPETLATRIKALRQEGIAFDIAGIAADDLNDGLLAELARHGNGRYYVVGKGDKEQDFAKQLAGAFRPAAENVKVQVHFNPERVASYKLIGFEKDRLNKEDFRNDAVDAAEMAAEEAGVAIYQVEPRADGQGELGEMSVRYRDTATGQMVERTWAIPYDQAAPTLERATHSMQLAVLSMLAGEKLKGGPLADAIDFGKLADARAKVRMAYGAAGRIGEMLQVIESLK